MHERAGEMARAEDLVDVDALIRAYDAIRPDPALPAQQVVFGTSGHRGSSLDGAFNEAHILAVAQAVAEHRLKTGVTGPLFLARDTHALSEPAWRTTLEVLVANGVDALIDARDGVTPTPAVSHAILHANRRQPGSADGVLLTPSHNPPRDGGIKYNPSSGGPAGSEATSAIARRANALIADGLREVRRVPIETALRQARRYDYMEAYVDDLPSVLDLDLIRSAGVRLAVDPLGGASVEYWRKIADRHRLDLAVINPVVDPRWAFMPLDFDGKIRMDCSSSAAMRNLTCAMAQAGAADIAVGNDADADRHGVVTPDGGLMNPNHFLAAAIAYVFTHRPEWPARAGVGKTLVSSSMIDRVAADLGRPLVETPVGFKYFVEGLENGSLGFAGEESAGASLLRRNGATWTTDKDGIVLGLLAAEMTARSGDSPSQSYGQLAARHGTPTYARIDAPATAVQKKQLASLRARDVSARELAGEPVARVMTEAPGNGALIGGVKVATANAWFAARPSGTEDVYKIYAESFLGPDHLVQVQREAQDLVSAALDH